MTDHKKCAKKNSENDIEILIEDTSYTEFRSKLKYYFDRLCEENQFLKICRYHGENVYIISEKKFLGMTSEELIAFQDAARSRSGNKKARLEAYYEKFTRRNRE